jgi:hypothetical protein
VYTFFLDTLYSKQHRAADKFVLANQQEAKFRAFHTVNSDATFRPELAEDSDSS